MSGDVTFKGPLFDGRADAELARGIHEARERVAAEGVRLARASFAGSIRDDRGRFLASIGVTDDSRVVATRGGHTTYTMPVTVDRSTESAVFADLATYGPWLEGTGSRNETTRFKGYHGFRKAAQELDRVAGDITEHAISPYVREMNE